MALATLTPVSVGLGQAAHRAWQATLRAALATTSSYVATDHVLCGVGEKITFQFSLVWADSTSTQWYYEWSSDGTLWYPSINLSASAGVNTVTLSSQTIVLGASTKWEDTLYVQDIYVRAYVKKTGGTGADSMAIFCTIMDR